MLFHCSGVLVTIERACTGPCNSSFKISFTRRCRCKGVGSLTNWSLTTITLKWVSEVAGTLCIWDSLRISRCSGCNSLVSLDSMDAATDVMERISNFGNGEAIFPVVGDSNFKNMIDFLFELLCCCVEWCYIIGFAPSYWPLSHHYRLLSGEKANRHDAFPRASRMEYDHVSSQYSRGIIDESMKHSAMAIRAILGTI